MLLTLADAAARLGQSVRQVRYALKKGALPARKVGGVWLVDESDLPVSPADARRRAEKVAALQQEVAEALAPHVEPGARYSVTTIRAFVDGVAIWRAAREQLPADHPALPCLASCNLAAARGAHAFRARAKADAYDAARVHAAEAIAWLHMLSAPESLALAGQIEARVLPALGGLVRRSESRSPR